MNTSLNDLKNDYYRLHDLERYQTSPRIGRETVLEHCGYVAGLVVKLRDIYEFDELKALKLALFHDYPEIAISDIPHNIKKQLGTDITERLEAAEYQFMETRLSAEFSSLLRQFNDFSTPEGLVVAYADVLSVETYCEREILLGNSRYFMEKVIPDVQHRKSELIDRLSPYKIKSDSCLSKEVRGTV